jgi:hypothetical protein
MLSKSTEIMKWVSIAALVLAMLFRASSGYQAVLLFVVCAGAVLVVLQTGRTGRYAWAAGFSAIAVLYNPLMPIALSRNIFLSWLCLATFAASLAVLKTTPQLSRPLPAKSARSRTSSRVPVVRWS